MKTIIYNEINFLIDKARGGWNIYRSLPDGSTPVVASGLFEQVPDVEAEKCLVALIKLIFPVGVRLVGPDVDHATKVGNLRIVGPDLRHPNFIHWNQDSSSFSK